MIKIKKVGWGFGLCNQNCIHCYNSSSLKKGIPLYTFDELKRVADKICPHISDINFGTGELLINPNSKKLLKYIRDNYPKVKIAVTSNGYSIFVLSKKEIKYFFHDIDISIDFPDKKRHNAFRRHPMAWDWAMAALKKLEALNIDRTVTTCVNSKTTDKDLLELLKLSKKHGAFLRLNWFRKTGRGKKELRLSSLRAWEVIKFLSDKVEFYSLDSVFAGTLGIKMDPCPACRGSMRIHQDMSVTPAPYLKGDNWSAGNILKDEIDLKEIYNSKAFKKIRNRNVKACKDCQYNKLCRSGCITRAILHNKDLNEIDDFCPVKAKISKRILNSIDLKVNKNCDLVHDGYLCTTIIKSL